MMQDYVRKMRQAGTAPAAILFPKEGTDLTRFAVLACDQHTSEPEYWEKAEEMVGSAPSALRLMVPEPWLGRPGVEKEAALTMRRYINEGILRPLGEGVMFVKRETVSGVRRGLLLCFDLEQYDYSPNSDTLLRATEETVKERLPARIEVRKDSPAEMPHILVLCEDRENRLMGTLDRLTEGVSPLYDFPLMLGGGRLSGWFINDPCTLDLIADMSNPNQIYWGQIYVVQLDDFRLVKYLRRHSDPNMVVLRSENPNYDDMDVRRSDIHEMLLVQHVLHLNTRL